jgi:cytochrome c551/c552
VEARDREKDKVSYLWDLGNGTTVKTDVPEISHTYNEAGEYRISVEVKDDKNASSKSGTVSVVAGNSRPEVSIALSSGNTSFFIPGVPLQYKVSVTDADASDTVDEKNIFVSLDYKEGMDEVNMSLGHQQVSAAITGKSLTMGLDCKACHKENEKSIGPSYMEVAQKYKNDKSATTYLKKKVVSGGSGVWGEVMMPAHPTLTQDEAGQIVQYIQSLAATGDKKKSLPVAGTIVPEAGQGANVLVLTASYTDNGGPVAKPLTGIKSVYLPSNGVSFAEDTKTDGFQPISFNGMDLMIVPKKESWIALPGVDLTGVSNVQLMAMWQSAPSYGLDFEMRSNSPTGTLLGTGNMPTPNKAQQGGVVSIKLSAPVQERPEEIYFVYAPSQEALKSDAMVVLSKVQFSAK